MLIKKAVLVLLGVFTFRAAAAQQPTTFNQTELRKLVFAEIVVMEPPTIFTADGARHLSYEVSITNASGQPWEIRRVEVLAEGRGGVLLAATGPSLREALSQWPGTGERARPDLALLPIGGRVLFYAWVDLPPGVSPRAIVHRVTFGPADGGPELTVETEPSVVRPATPLVAAAPFRGTNWVAARGPSNGSPHRRAVLPLGGVPRVPQRFAIDWLQVDSSGNTFKGDGSVNESYYAYGKEIHAILGGIVTVARDGIADNRPGAWPTVPMTLETVAGNHILVDVGHQRWVMYAHLKPGSVRVKAGDRITAGQVLGLLGNSGNTPEPHLHLQVMDRNSPLGGQGLPYQMDRFTVLGKASIAFGGQPVEGGPKADWLTKPVVRRGEIALENVIVKFP